MEYKKYYIKYDNKKNNINLKNKLKIPDECFTSFYNKKTLNQQKCLIINKKKIRYCKNCN
jgi:hypothetical protein